MQLTQPPFSQGRKVGVRIDVSVGLQARIDTLYAIRIGSVRYVCRFRRLRSSRVDVKTLLVVFQREFNGVLQSLTSGRRILASRLDIFRNGLCKCLRLPALL